LKYRATQTNSEELSSVETPLGVGVLRGFPSTSLVTSNDLLFTLHGAYSPRPLNYEIVAQSADEVRNVRNAPALSMGTYLEESGQARILATISIYSQLGKSQEQVRLLSMNSVALLIWQAMRRHPRLIGAHTALPKPLYWFLAFRSRNDRLLNMDLRTKVQTTFAAKPTQGMNHTCWPFYLNTDERLDELCSDHRFDELWRRIGLPLVLFQMNESPYAGRRANCVRTVYAHPDICRARQYLRRITSCKEARWDDG
jgi:hypothetical protein